MRLWASVGLVLLAAALLLIEGAPADSNASEKLARFRNLGKAFYENPTTQREAVDAFQKALALAPESNREKLNYALALLRAGQNDQAIALLEQVQKLDAKLPHTWFNLGIYHKKQGETAKAAMQFERMIQLDPNEPISKYNLGALYKSLNRPDDAIRQLRAAVQLNPSLSAPHFQLFNILRTTGHPDEAKQELAIFQELKKAAEGAAIPEDVDWSQYAEVYDPPDAHSPGLVKAEPQFESISIPGNFRGLVPFDPDRSGRTKLLAWSENEIRILPDGVRLSVPAIRTVVPGDFNNDGWTDLCIITASGPVLYVNTKGKFELAKPELPKGDFTGAVWVDYDHDYDLDLLLIGPKPMLLRNQGPAGFADHTADFPFVAGEALSVASFRAVPDTKGFDLVVSNRNGPGIFYRDLLGGKYEAVQIPIPAGAVNLQVADLDNDGSFDLIYSLEGRLYVIANKSGVFAEPHLAGPGSSFALTDLENDGHLRIAQKGGLLGYPGGKAIPFQNEDAAKTANCVQWAAADLDNDGRVDLACAGPDGARVIYNRAKTNGKWLTVHLNGVKNLLNAAGAEVEIKAGLLYQKLPYSGVPLHFGLGLESEADTIRVTWPNGLIQNELHQTVGKHYDFKEAQRLSGSCPIIWSWNGREFEYITDVLGVAPLGASSGDGKYFPVNHNESIVIPGESLRPRNGEFEIRVSEELSEVSYLDQLQLIAVDHPNGTSFVTSSKFKGPRFPEYKLFPIHERFYPLSAFDDKGRDVRAALLAKDKKYPDQLNRTAAGVATLHSLDLDFGHQTADGRAILVLNGWVDWADGSTFLGMAQESKDGLILPYLQVQDEHSQWRTVIEDMGIPSGKPKAIAVDLSGKFLSTSRKVRIVTNLCVYWDEIFLTGAFDPGELKQTIVPQVSANLHFRGFSPTIIHPQRKQPEVFLYPAATLTSLWNPTPGLYTRFGDVSELMRDVDDKLVVMGSGDEVSVRFKSDAVGPPPAGFVRDYVLRVDGWAKDRDANTAFSQTTEPLPFHAMSQYPYPAPERFPDDAEHKEYRRLYLTRPALQLLRRLRGTQ